MKTENNILYLFCEFFNDKKKKHLSFIKSKQDQVLMNAANNRDYFTRFFKCAAQILLKYKIGQRSILQAKKQSNIQQALKSAQNKLWKTPPLDIGVKSFSIDFTNILLVDTQFINNTIVSFQKISRKILIQFSSRTNGYSKKSSYQSEISSVTNKGKEFAKYDILQGREGSDYFRYSISGHISRQYDPRLFRSKCRKS